jgi:tetratricopeptide (TPR) repeat protein
MNLAVPTNAPAAQPARFGDDARASLLRRWMALHFDLVLAVLVGLVTLVLYARAARFDFVDFDDGAYVFSNPDLPLGLGWAGLRYAFTAHEPYWHPLVWIINLAIYGRFGVQPWPYHVVNICFHAGSAGLLLLFWVRATGCRWAAVVAASLWAWHPLRVESVVWIAETKDIAAGFFWILGMLLYAGYARRPGGRRYLAVSVAYAAALCCKPSVVTFPLALLLLDFWPLGRARLGRRSTGEASAMPWMVLVAEKLPWLAMAAAVSVGSYLAQRNGRAMTSGVALPVAARVQNGLVCYLWYAWKNFWPSRLAIFYPHPYMLAHQIQAWQWIGAVVVLVAITVFAALRWHRSPSALVGWLWFLGTMIPMIGLVQVGLQAKADRHSLIPSIGLIAGVVFPVGALVRQRPPTVRRAVAAAVCVLLVVELTATWLQIGTWRNTRTVFAHAMEVVPNNFMAATILAQEATNRAEALKLAHEAVRMAPDQAMSHQALGFEYDAEGKLRDALREFEGAARLNPTSVRGCDEVGHAEIRLGRYDAALGWYRAALRLDADDLMAQHNVALCLAHQGHLPEAIAKWQRLLAEHPGFGPGHTRLAEALQQQGDLHGAAQHYQAAVALGEKDATVEANDAWCVATDPLAGSDQVDRALGVAADAAEQTHENDALVLDAYAAALARAGQFDRAQATAQRAAGLASGQPKLAAAIARRAAVYASGQPYLIHAH